MRLSVLWDRKLLEGWVFLLLLLLRPPRHTVLANSTGSAAVAGPGAVGPCPVSRGWRSGGTFRPPRPSPTSSRPFSVSVPVASCHSPESPEPSCCVSFVHGGGRCDVSPRSLLVTTGPSPQRPALQGAESPQLSALFGHGQGPMPSPEWPTFSNKEPRGYKDLAPSSRFRTGQRGHHSLGAFGVWAKGCMDAVPQPSCPLCPRLPPALRCPAVGGDPGTGRLSGDRPAS